MIKKFTTIDTEIIELLGQATASSNVASELENYVKSANRELYLSYRGEVLVGCIGIEIVEEKGLEITHIATAKTHRFKRVGSDMIDYIRKVYSPSKVVAETDNDAVDFYKSYRFEIFSLGEKYPGVERFNCVL
ncbi:GNAT family N-acetyltransferase [Candidatus Enterococcus mansonii]|uniref:N-acetyltransferase domain-containing protein n=1 Tax=Candidatus Enterococcus mansonii TaxID=1834181 RepID=A0A242CI82_9ENTE|nr:GNAT family N-acetyltransferase [Enterococcus sp. 4G2_DIV0659]OTO09921.1 hypothetical protein A5880_000604 [Enterococcus sp. 4G2_DIV0659]